MNLELLDPTVAASLKTYNITAKAIACDPELADTAAFCEHYGYTPDQSANTIIVASRTEPITYVACLVLATTKLDVNKKVRQLTDIRKLSFATAEQTTALTNMRIGGVTIVGISGIPIYIDAAVMARPEVIIGGGNRTSKILIKPQELVKLPGVEVIEQLGLPR